MRRVQTKQTLKLRLLAFVLALLLVWYSLNPAPRAAIRKKKAEEPPDEKRQNLEPQAMSTTLNVAFRRLGAIGEPSKAPYEDGDDFEWPEFIDG